FRSSSIVGSSCDAPMISSGKLISAARTVPRLDTAGSRPSGRSAPERHRLLGRARDHHPETPAEVWEQRAEPDRGSPGKGGDQVHYGTSSRIVPLCIWPNFSTPTRARAGARHG